MALNVGKFYSNSLESRLFLDLLYRHLFAIDPLFIYSLSYSISYFAILAEYILLLLHTQLLPLAHHF